MVGSLSTLSWNLNLKNMPSRIQITDSHYWHLLTLAEDNFHSTKPSLNKINKRARSTTARLLGFLNSNTTPNSVSYTQTLTRDIVINSLTSVKCSRSFFFNCTTLKILFNNNNNNNINNNNNNNNNNRATEPKRKLLLAKNPECPQKNGEHSSIFQIIW